MVERKEYLDQLWAWKDEQQIKVVTGIRRCGKSVLLEQYQQRLLANGVAPEQIISINFENLDYEPLKDYMKLYNYLKERLCKDKMTYIFLDEVQEVPSFEKVVDSLYIRDHVDVYITGSNAFVRKVHRDQDAAAFFPRVYEGDWYGERGSLCRVHENWRYSVCGSNEPHG